MRYAVRIQKLVGGPGFEPGPHGPELCEVSSRSAPNDRFQFEMSDWETESVQNQNVFLPDCYMKYYRAFGDRGGSGPAPSGLPPALARGILYRCLTVLTPP